MTTIPKLWAETAIFVTVDEAGQGKDGFACEATRRMYFAAIQSLLTAAGVAVGINGAVSD